MTISNHTEAVHGTSQKHSAQLNFTRFFGVAKSHTSSIKYLRVYIRLLKSCLFLHACAARLSCAHQVAGMIEYILIAGVNDSKECAHLLGNLLKNRNVMLNVIPYNDTTQVSK